MTRTRRTRRRSAGWVALLFLLPAALIYLVFFGYGFGFLFQTSLTKVSISFFDPVFVGLQNYVVLFSDGKFLRAIFNNVAFGAISIAAALVIGFFIAVALASGARGRGFYYVLFLLPSLMPVAAVGTIFGSIFQYQFGAVNETLRALGLGALAQHWLTEPGPAFAVVATIFCYLIGLPIMYYTADLSALPTEQLEAALLDGAGAFRIMRSVIHPAMRSTHTTVILSLALGSFRALEQVFFSTGGGPAGSTEIVGTYLYQFTTSAGATTGFVSAAAIIVLLVAAVIAVIQLIVGRLAERNS